METFEVYLPSNACEDIYPNNTSSDFKTCFDHPIELEGKWEVGVQSVFYSAHINEETRKERLYCDVKMKKNNVEEEIERSFTFDVFPWHHESMEKAMESVNQQVKTSLQAKFNSYDTTDHHFHLSLSENGYVKLVLGRALKIQMSTDLFYLFGLPQAMLQNPETHGVRPVGKTISRERRLFILSNVAKPTAFGQHHLQILQSFLHKPKTGLLCEKRFQPIMYLPVKSNSIDMIQLQLTDDYYNPICINDSKTVVCLYFRKVREKTMM